MTDRRRRRLSAIVVLLTLSVPSHGFGGERALSDVFENPDRYHGSRVVVSGVVTAVTRRVSRKGDPYYAFDLSDGTRTVTVLGSGHPPCAIGVRARVSGTVEITKRPGRAVVVINAVEVTCRPPKPPGAPSP